jgi:hypothetical protein
MILIGWSPADRLWWLRAAACTDPGYEARRQDVRDSAGTAGMEGFAPIEEAAPGWTQRS